MSIFSPRRFLHLALLALCCLSLGAAELRIVATTGMVADVVAGVAGERASVSSLMGAGIDPHLYRPTRSDVKALLAADMVFYNGLHLEGKMGEVFAKIKGKKPVCAVTAELSKDKLLAGDHDEHDPHVWNDPAAWRATVDVVLAKLLVQDPAGKEVYAANAKAYAQQLEALAAYGKKCVASIPAERRILVTAHDAFAYFGKGFGFEVMGIQGVSTESEAGLDRINKMVDVLVQRKVPAIFVESSVSEKNIKALIEGAAKRGHKVVIGGELFSDAMGKKGAYTGTYVGMQDHNITTVVRALGGTAPATGMQGKLSATDH